ncbi:hypothetical protein R3W88_019001 [Solanum pinnatisectum]|uniref:Uncharacterized protein n=1 Tax=Solanum pinnatisectum TaxID=50273 RepID=A0AAV9KIF1_9SOLN|nr:hypothetical protein R3W88_019001 [Solanum pinnatisectum]
MENLKKNDCHVLLVSFPMLGVHVTYCTSLSGFNRISNLATRDFPSFVFTNVKYNDWATQSIKEHIQLLNSEENPRILVMNTLDALEFDALRVLKDSVTMVGVGPSIPSAFLEGKDRSDTSFGTDLQSISKNYMDWLDEKPNELVIYIAFGSYAEISNQLMEERAEGLLKSGRPFLWVVRKGINGENPEEKLRCKQELEKQGKIVTWCSQVEVLHHPSMSCFLNQCGWNSTLESTASGVPIVACLLWNQRRIQDFEIIGLVRVNDEGIVEKDDLERCIDVVMKGEECRKNAKKWRDLAKKATKENGSSN